jgi:hypothetical protein
MAISLSNLGNGNGHIIAVRTDNSKAIAGWPNSIQGTKEAINHALAAGVLVGSRAAHGSITVDDLTGMAAESVTAIDINGNTQIGASVVVGAHTLITYATALAAAINGFTPGAGPDYTATSIGNVVNVIAPASVGSTVNGSAITLSKTNAGILTTELDIDNGSEADTPYDKVFGYRYYLNPTPGSLSNDFAGGGEITKNIVMRGLQSTYDTITHTVGVGATSITLARTMISMNILMDAGAPETIDTIGTSGFTIGDQILLSNAAGGSVITINETGNVVLANSSDFVSGDPELVLALKLTDVSGVLKWSEIYRSPNIEISVAAMRAAGMAQPANSSTEVVMIAGGQVVAAPVAGTDPGYIRVTGSPALTGAFVMTAPSGSPLGRDRFIVDYKATPTDAGGSVTIYGKVLTDEEMIDGSTRIEAWYEVGAATWAISKIPNSDAVQYIKSGNVADNAIGSNELQPDAVATINIISGNVTNDKLGNGSVTPQKVNTAMKRKMVTYPVSWESGGLGTNIATEMGGKGVVTKIIVSVTLLVEATNDGTVSVFNTTGAASIGNVTIPAGTVRGASVVSTVFTDPTFDDGDIVTISTSKVTAGGEATVTLVYDAAE